MKLKLAIASCALFSVGLLAAPAPASAQVIKDAIEKSRKAEKKEHKAKQSRSPFEKLKDAKAKESRSPFRKKAQAKGEAKGEAKK